MTLKERIKNELMVIKALGVVFGDIGTSPIYTFAIVMALVSPTFENINAMLSFVFWTMTILVTIQYAWLATSLSKRGEGGTIVLLQILRPYIKGAKTLTITTLLSIVGLSLLIGDGVITPAISIISAVEGGLLIPGYENTSKEVLLIIASLIALSLFAVQKKGIEKVASAFGPIVVIWFLSLLFVGGYNILQNPNVLGAINPSNAIHFILEHPVIAFVMLADVLLAATGGEALYADMGHLGRLPILKGWLFAFVALIASYYGQGAFLLSHPEAANSPLYEMHKAFNLSLYIPFLILSIMATVIASQAMISGIFSVIYQAMNTRIFPHFKVSYTSYQLRSQIYIGAVNWFLLISVIAMMWLFRESGKLAAAYGLSVVGAMTITGILMTMIFAYQKKYIKMSFAIFSGLTSFIYLASATLKIPHGGYWSLIIASIPFVLIMIYTAGQKRLYKILNPTSKKIFLDKFENTYKNNTHIKGIALFFSRRADSIPTYIEKTMFQNGIIYDRNIIVVVNISNEPVGVRSILTPFSDGLEYLEVNIGYMDMLNITEVLHEKNIDEKTIFYGEEEIVSQNPIWKFFAFIKDVSPNFVSFYNFPPEKLIGVSRRVEM